MSDSYELATIWADRDAVIRRIAARCELYKDPTDRVFSEAAEAEKLAEAKEAFEEESHQLRLAVLRQRLKIEKRDGWLRPGAYYWMAVMRCFVTVGSTEFDALIGTIIESECRKSLQKLGITDLLLQIGRGKIEPEKGIRGGINVDFYRYKDDILPDIRSADLVIGHAGAGTCLEVLRHRKPFVVVINEELMDNHQRELAERFAELGYAICTVPTRLGAILGAMREIGQPKSFVEPDYGMLTKIITRYMGVID